MLSSQPTNHQPTSYFFSAKGLALQGSRMWWMLSFSSFLANCCSAWLSAGFFHQHKRKFWWWNRAFVSWNRCGKNIECFEWGFVQSPLRGFYQWFLHPPPAPTHVPQVEGLPCLSVSLAAHSNTQVSLPHLWQSRERKGSLVRHVCVCV